MGNNQSLKYTGHNEGKKTYEKATLAPKAFSLRHILYITASILLIQKFLEFWVVISYVVISQPNMQEVVLFFFLNCVSSGALIQCDTCVPVTKSSFKPKKENYCLHDQCHAYRCTGFRLGVLKGMTSQPGAPVGQTEWWVQVPAEMEK